MVVALRTIKRRMELALMEGDLKECVSEHMTRRGCGYGPCVTCATQWVQAPPARSMRNRGGCGYGPCGQHGMVDVVDVSKSMSCVGWKSVIVMD